MKALGLMGGLFVVAPMLAFHALGAFMRYRTVTTLELTLTNGRPTRVEAARVEFIESVCGPHDLVPGQEVVCSLRHRGGVEDMSYGRIWEGSTLLRVQAYVYRGTTETQRLTFEADGGVSLARVLPSEARWEARLARARDAGPQN